jgi:uncharacterized membrane protein YgcG
MSYKRTKNCVPIIIAVSIIALALVTTISFNHSYTAFAVLKKKGGSSGTTTSSSKGNSGGGFTIGGASSSSSATTSNPNTLTKKELSSFISCINTANKSTEGLTHKIVTNCLDTAKGITPTTANAASSSTTTGRSSSSSSSPSLSPSGGSST